MVTFRDRFAYGADIVAIFGWCAAIIHGWSVLMFLRNLPGWLLYLSVWEMTGILAYSQLLAFLESIAAVTILVLLSILLPRDLLRTRFVSHASLMVLITALSAVGAHCFHTVPMWPSRKFVLGTVLVITVMMGCCALMRRYPNFEGTWCSFVERFQVLLLIYLPLTFFSSVVILVRNVWS